MLIKLHRYKIAKMKWEESSVTNTVLTTNKIWTRWVNVNKRPMISGTFDVTTWTLIFYGVNQGISAILKPEEILCRQAVYAFFITAIYNRRMCPRCVDWDSEVIYCFRAGILVKTKLQILNSRDLGNRFCEISNLIKLPSSLFLVNFIWYGGIITHCRNLVLTLYQYFFSCLFYSDYVLRQFIRPIYPDISGLFNRMISAVPMK